jgi:hypothetical protein
MNMTTNSKIKVPAGNLRLDGATYQHREVLKANGWEYGGSRTGWSQGAWHKTTTTPTNVPVRTGCRLLAEIDGKLTLIYDVGGVSMTAEQIHAI